MTWNRWIDELHRNVKIALRMLWRTPLVSAAALLSITLGVGANSALLSIVNAVMFRVLPVSHPEQLYVAQLSSGERDIWFSYPFVERAAAAISGRGLLCAESSIQPMQVPRAGGEVDAQPTQVQLISADCFRVLAQRPQAGRLLEAGDFQRSSPPAAVISDGYWSRRFARDPSAVGSELLINGTAVTIVGVTSAGYTGSSIAVRAPDIWAPAPLQPQIHFAGTVRRVGGDLAKPWPEQRELTWLTMLTRVSSGDPVVVASALTIALHAEGELLSGSRTDAARRLAAAAVRLTDGSRGMSAARNELRDPLYMLLTLVTLLLALACANIANLLLARATQRHQEVATRLALGAAPGQIVRQLLTESLVLAAIGGGLALVVGRWGSRALITFLNGGSVVSGMDVAPDTRVVVLTLGLAVLTSLSFSILPALFSARVAPATVLRGTGRGTIGTGQRSRIGRVLVATQMSLSVVLLILATLFSQSLREVSRADVGFDREQLVLARIAPAGGAQAVGAYARLTEAIAAVPRVTSVSMSAMGPFSGARARRTFQIQGYESGGGEPLSAVHEWVTPDYFRTVGLKIVEGRPFLSQDVASSRRVAVINQHMARHYFPNQNAVGRTFSYGGNAALASIEIVGVAENAGSTNMRDVPDDMIYLPAAQSEQLLGSIEVRADDAPVRLIPAIRAAIARSDPRVAVLSLDTLDGRIEGSIAGQRLVAWLTGAFGVVALLLAALGLYGTISYRVALRTSELGVRLALGAMPGSVQWLIVREALKVVLVGLAVGLGLAFAGARLVSGLLYGVRPDNPIPYTLGLALVIVAAILAAFVPARRAARLNLTVALRGE